MIPSKQPSVAILGAGLSGLSLAYFLKKKGVRPLLFDKNPPGGKIQSHLIDNILYEKGPLSLRYPSGHHPLISMIENLNLPLLLPARYAKKRHIYYQGQLHKVSSLFTLCRHPFSINPLSLFLKEQKTRPLNQSDISVKDWLKHHNILPLSPLVDAFFQGVWGSDITKTSMAMTFPHLWNISQQKGSIIRHRKKPKRSSPSPSSPLKKYRLFSFPDGIQQFIKALADVIGPSHFYQEHARALSFTNTSAVEVSTDKNIYSVSSVISTVPAPALCSIIKESQFIDLTHGQSLEKILKKISYTHFQQVSLFYNKNVCPIKTFGYLVPQSEQKFCSGTIFNHCVFPSRFQKNNQMYTLFFPYRDAPYLHIENKAIMTLKEHLQIRHHPHKININHVPQALPLFPVGYKENISIPLKKLTMDIPLSIQGAFISKPSINDIVKNAHDTVEKFIKNNSSQPRHS